MNNLPTNSDEPCTLIIKTFDPEELRIPSCNPSIKRKLLLGHLLWAISFWSSTGTS
jgi:hypothetical protein